MLQSLFFSGFSTTPATPLEAMPEKEFKDNMPSEASDGSDGASKRFKWSLGGLFDTEEPCEVAHLKKRQITSTGSNHLAAHRVFQDSCKLELPFVNGSSNDRAASNDQGGSQASFVTADSVDTSRSSHRCFTSAPEPSPHAVGTPITYSIGNLLFPSSELKAFSLKLSRLFFVDQNFKYTVTSTLFHCAFAKGSCQEASSAAGAPMWLWTFVHSLDVVTTLTVIVECIKLETPSLQFMIEDTNISAKLE